MDYSTEFAESYWTTSKPNLLFNLNRLYLKQTLNTAPSYNSTYHRLSHILKGHLGCINTLHWSTDGKLLLSGSDDQCLLIHKYTPGHSDPLQRFKVKNRFQTAHTNNIFDAKFAPGDQNKIVSVAADGRICIIDDWNTRGWDSLNTRTLIASETHDARRLEFIDRSVFFVACEDGTVKQFDLRDSTPVNRSKIDLFYEQVGIHSISSCPSAPHLLAVSGSDPFIRIYDIRSSLDLTTCDLWTPPLKSDKKTNFCTGVRFSRFGYTLAANYIKDGPYLIDPIYQNKDRDVSDFLKLNGLIKNTGLTYELETWKRIHESYNSRRFSTAEKDLRFLITQHQNLQNDYNWIDILAYEIFNRVLCLGQMNVSPSETTIKENILLVIKMLDHWPAKYLLVMYFFSLGLIENASDLCDTFIQQNVRKDQNEWTNKLEQIRSISAVCELDPAQIPKLIPKTFKQACSEVPFVDLCKLPITRRLIDGFNGYLAYYPGVLHERTLKGISFVGDSDQLLGVGSDGGYAFLFKCPDKTGSCDIPVWATKSDSSVVNVVEGHPFLPCIAVSGIDYTIKIWEPEVLNNTPSELDNPDYKAFTTVEIPDLMNNLSQLQGINRLQFQMIDSSDLVIYF